MLITWRGLKAVGRRQIRVGPTLLPFSLPQYQQPLDQSVRMLEGINVLNILSVNSTVYYFHKTHRDWNCSYKSLTDHVKPETRLAERSTLHLNWERPALYQYYYFTLIFRFNSVEIYHRTVIPTKPARRRAFLQGKLNAAKELKREINVK